MADIETNEAEESQAFLLGDGDCMVFDADLLDPENDDSEPAGDVLRQVLAVQFRDGALWWLSGRDRKWHNAEKEDSKPKRASLKTV